MGLKTPKNALVAAVGVGAMLLASLSVSGAAHAETDVIELATQPPVSYHQWEFGGPESEQTIDTGVRTIVADLGLPIQGTIDCWVKSFTEYTEVTKTEAEWLASPSIALPDDFTLSAGDSVYVTCRSGEEEYWAGFYIQWTMVAVAGAAESVSLPVDPDTAWARHDTNYVSVRNPAIVPGRAGDVVHVVGPAGTFLPDEPLTGAFGGSNIDQDGWFDHVYFSEDAAVAPDGSLLSFTIPADDRDLLDDDEPMYAEFITGRTSDELPPGPSQSSRTIWHGGFDLSSSPQQVSSSAHVELGFSRALSIQRVRATAFVDVPAGDIAVGEVTFLVNGKKVGTAHLTPTSDNRVSIRLPRLSRGWHAVTVQFAGSENVAPSTSPPATLRILL